MYRNRFSISSGLTALLILAGGPSILWSQIPKPTPSIEAPQGGAADSRERQVPDEPTRPAAPQRERRNPNAREARPVLDVRLRAGEERGVAVTALRPNGAAAKAGIEQGDVILKIDDQEISQPESVLAILREKKVGERVTVVVLRDGEEQTIQVTLGSSRPVPESGGDRDAARPDLSQERSEASDRRRSRRMLSSRDAASRTGDSANRSNQERQSYQLQGGWLGVAVERGGEDIKGLRVKRVFPEGPAARAGILKDDILLKIEGKLLTEHQDLAEALKGTEAGQTVAILTTRGPDPKLHEQVKQVRLGKGPGNNGVGLDEMEQDDPRRQSQGFWEDSQGFATQIPADAYELEYRRRMAQQNERLERLLVGLSEELKELREEVAELKEAR